VDTAHYRLSAHQTVLADRRRVELVRVLERGDLNACIIRDGDTNTCLEVPVADRVVSLVRLRHITA
jgi:hypothetical protein